MIRAARAGDQAYVAATWVRSVASTAEAKRAGRSRTIRAVGDAVDVLLDRADTRILIAADDRDTDKIEAWIAFVAIPRDVLLVHYLYTQAQHRGRGLARALVAAASEGLNRERSICYTYRGPSAASLLARFAATYVAPSMFVIK